MRAKRLQLQQKPPTDVVIESLDQDGRGVAHIDGKATFIHGALPGEHVSFVYTSSNRRFDTGRIQAILQPAVARTNPRCSHFGQCGGCSLQHLISSEQLRAKEQILRDALTRIAKIQPEFGYLAPLESNTWGYRRKARISVKYVVPKEKLLIGFRERNSAFVADLNRCEVLHPRLGQKIEELRSTLAQLSILRLIPQLEMSMGEDACALIVRVLAYPTASDRELLKEFGIANNICVYLQYGKPLTIEPLTEIATLGYSIPQCGLYLQFQPLHFTQVNLELNQMLIARVLELLNPQTHQHVLDLFCGIGNFTLPLATRAASVTGVEGDPGLVAQARINAVNNQLDNCKFYCTDLYKNIEKSEWITQQFDQIVLDPPRSGAAEVLPYLPKLKAKQILYISCYPATLARDAAILTQEFGYKLHYAGVMDMFPHTNHVESIALFAC
ncbi:23S rRNA methyltransferase [Achromatium sp. WMS2]|nr:23S rRNA methyltransferase [Achromatium sp. WMS2]